MEEVKGLEKDEKEKDYEAEAAADTLIRAAEIQKDKSLMARVHQCIDAKQAALAGLKDKHKMVKSIGDLKEISAKKDKEAMS